MTDQPAFLPEPLDPDAEGPDAIAPVWDPHDWPEMADATPSTDENSSESPAADTQAPDLPPAATPWQDPFAGRGPTTHDNYLGSYAMFFGIMAFVATAALYLLGAGLWWLNVVLGGVGVYYGFRGVNATVRGRATNRSAAIFGWVLGLVTSVASAIYLVLAAYGIMGTLV